MDENFQIEESLCGECRHRFSRVFVPFDPTMFGIDSNEEIDEVEQHTCLVSGDDIMGIVTECNCYESKINNKSRCLFNDAFKDN